MDNLDILFNPKTVVVVGASANPTKWGNWITEQVVRHKDARTIYLINPNREIVCECETIESVLQLPGPIDVAVVAVPVHLFESTVDDLLGIGVKAIIGITAGFSERNPEGTELEARVAKKIADAGSIFVGPNCAGVWDSYSPFHCLPIAEFVAGPIALISQSGGIITDVGIRLQELGLGYSRVASIGNQAGVNIEDLILNFDEDPNTKVIAIYAENERTIPFHIIRRTKNPVVVMTPGDTPATKRAALLHTNSCVYPKKYTKRSMELNFGLFADNTRDFVATIQLALSRQAGTGQRIAIATDTGGMGIMMASAVEEAGYQVNEPSEGLKQEIFNNISLPQSALVNPYDMINIKSGFSEPTVKIMQTLQSSPEVDAIIMVLFLIENAEMFYEQEYECGLQLASHVRAGSKPVLFVCKTLTSPGTKALLSQHMPVYRDVDTAVSMLEILCG